MAVNPEVMSSTLIRRYVFLACGGQRQRGVSAVITMRIPHQDIKLLGGRVQGSLQLFSSTRRSDAFDSRSALF